MKRWTILGIAGLVAGFAACSGDTVAPTLAGSINTTRGGAAGTDTTSTPGGTDTSTTGPTTSNGPVASLSITPHEVTLSLGYYTSLAVIARDSAGARVVKPVAWRSSNPAVAVASDTSIVYAKAVGAAKIYATLDGITDSATITVVPRPQRPTNPAPVSSFDLTVIAYRIIGPDTSHTERVAGATVTVVRVGGVSGDALATPQEAGSGVTGANGEAKFAHLAGGSYIFRVTPPSGSPYLAAQVGIGPPSDSTINVSVSMRRQ